MSDAMKLSEAEAQTKLTSLPGWEFKNGEITKLYKFKDFLGAIDFVSMVAGIAEAHDHHPDILIQYNKVRLTLSTHSVGGLTEKDFMLAREIDLPVKAS